MNLQAVGLLPPAMKRRKALLLDLEPKEGVLTFILVAEDTTRVPMTLPVLAVPSSQAAFSLLLRLDAGSNL